MDEIGGGLNWKAKASDGRTQLAGDLGVYDGRRGCSGFSEYIDKIKQTYFARVPKS